METLTPRRRFGLRAQLLLLSIAVLAVPWAGVGYVRELERHLREAFAASLADAARAVAGPLHNQPQMFPFSPADTEHTLYVHRLRHAIAVDGYTDDWADYLDWTESFGAQGGDGMDIIVGRYRGNYHVLVRVRDDHTVLQRASVPDALDNDHVALVLGDEYGNPVRHYFSPSVPGPLRPFTFSYSEDQFRFRHRQTTFVTNVRGDFEAAPGGYNLEIVLPASVVHERMGIEWVDVDDPGTRTVAGGASSMGIGPSARPAQLVQASAELLRVLGRFADTPGRRVWVLDERGRVLASAGDLARTFPEARSGGWYRWLVPPVAESFTDDLAGSSRLHGVEVESALSGEVATRWRTTTDGRAVVVTAAAPVINGAAIQGAVVVEESTGALQLLQREAMIALFNRTFAVFTVLTLLALVFATRLSLRLRRLAAAAESAIDVHGRVVGAFDAPGDGDEIGDLGRTFSALLGRLAGYHRYMESLAGRLSHELRTPIAVVRSSLEHLAEARDDRERNTYIERAREGVDRLSLLVTRLSEAARLEQALQGAAREPVPIRDLVRRSVAGYSLAFGNVVLEDATGTDALVCPVVPDLIEQLLDKLIANAVDFRVPGSPVAVGLAADAGTWRLHVANQGPPLPVVMQGQLFDSMVSVRESRGRGDPHLGLGLYIVRLIAEFHGGRVTATNLPDGAGVCFSVTFPRVGRPSAGIS